MMERLEQILRFLQEAEGLKSTLRTAWTAAGRRESTAEHSWRLALFAWLYAGEDPTLDREKLLKLCLVHDLGELDTGDISAALLPDASKKHAEEQRTLKRVTALLPDKQAAEIRALWADYNAGTSPEARLVKALDKAETILQHNQGKNPPDFDYAFNLQYGAAYFQDAAGLRALRSLLDAQTRSRLEQNQTGQANIDRPGGAT